MQRDIARSVVAINRPALCFLYLAIILNNSLGGKDSIYSSYLAANNLNVGRESEAHPAFELNSTFR
jgi:hypothetical protein